MLFSENVCVFWNEHDRRASCVVQCPARGHCVVFRRESCVVNCKAHAISGFGENLQILPMGNVRHFRRFRKNDDLFCENVRFLYNLVNSWENLQILPLGNVRHFRRIRKNDVLFLKMCVFY